MCGLCGMFEGGRRWLDAGTTLDPSQMRRARRRRVALIREVLRPARIAVDDWEGASFILRGPTGKTEIVDNLFDLWRRAEALGHRALDPLTEDFADVAEDQSWGSVSFPDWRSPPPFHSSGAPASAPDDEPGAHRIPVYVLTGFLGSGKTTMLNRLLREPTMSDSAVLINEFGAVSIDHHLVERMQTGDAIDVIVLKGGCACCAVRGDLVAALRELYAKRAGGALSFRRVLLETSGLADPAPLLFTLAADPALRHKFVAGALLATVDALHGADQSARHPEWHRQVAVADRLVITKTDLGDTSDAARLAAKLSRINPAADIVDGTRIGSIDRLLEPTQMLPTARLGHLAQGLGSGGHARGHSTVHTPDVSSICFALPNAIEWSALAVWLTRLLHVHGERIIRFKAVLDVLGWPVPVALDGLNHLIHQPRHIAAWPAGWRGSQFVFIAQGLQIASIERSMRASVARAGSSQATIAARPSPISQASSN